MYSVMAALHHILFLLVLQFICFLRLPHSTKDGYLQRSTFKIMIETSRPAAGIGVIEVVVSMASFFCIGAQLVNLVRTNCDDVPQYCGTTWLSGHLGRDVSGSKNISSNNGKHKG